MKHRAFLFCLAGAFVLGSGSHQVCAQTNYDDVLLVINSNSPISEQVGLCFANARAIPTANIARIAVSTEEEIDSLGFNSLRAQVENHIVSRGLTDRINYIVTTKGVPLKVDRGNTFSSSSPSSSVESELTLILGSYTSSIGGIGIAYNPYYYQNAHFSRAAYGIYLVARLDGYSFEQIKGLIDRGGPNRRFSASRSKFVFDQDPDWNSLLPGLNNSMATAQTTLAGRGFTASLDPSTTYLTNQSDVIGYTSWGSNDHYAEQYIVHAKPNNTWVAGAIAETYVSTGGRTFTAPPTYGQSLVADLIEEGLTGVKGYVYEPFSFAVAVVSVLFDRYTNGYNLAESYYMASRSLSWMDVVIGDPKTAIYPDAYPIELATLTAQMVGQTAELKWSTVSETNNYGFEIQRKADTEAQYKSIAGAFVPGHGTTLEPHSYSYVDVSIPPGEVSYRLKQIDLDGTVAYHGPVEVINSSSVSRSRVERAVLAQNYPNPFNPSTRIAFELPASAHVSLKIYNSLGQEVVTLVNEEKRAGRHEVMWDAANMPSGVYFCQFRAGEFAIIKRMMLVK